MKCSTSPVGCDKAVNECAIPFSGYCNNPLSATRKITPGKVIAIAACKTVLSNCIKDQHICWHNFSVVFYAGKPFNWRISKKREPSLVSYMFVTRTERVIFKGRGTTRLQIISLWVVARSNRLKTVETVALTCWATFFSLICNWK